MTIGDKIRTPASKIEHVSKVSGGRVWTYESQMPYLVADVRVVK